MSSQAIGQRHGTLTSELGGPGPFQRAGVAVGDLLVLAGVVFCIPFVILAIGLPVALLARLLLWLGQLL